MSSRRRSLSPSPRSAKDGGGSPRRRTRSFRLESTTGLQSESSRAALSQHLIPSVAIPPLILPSVLVAGLDTAAFHLPLDRVPTGTSDSTTPPALSRSRSREPATSSASSSTLSSTASASSTNPPQPPYSTPSFASTTSSTSTSTSTSTSEYLQTTDETTSCFLITRLLSVDGFGDHDAEMVQVVLAIHEYFIKTDVLLSLILSLCCPSITHHPLWEDDPLLPVLETVQRSHSSAELQARALYLIDVWTATDVRRVSEGAGESELMACLRAQTDCNAVRIVASVDAARLAIMAHIEGPGEDDLHSSVTLHGQDGAGWVKTMLLEQLSVAELAYALTWCEWSLLARIPLHEFLLKRHTKIELSPNYHRLTDYFNKIVAWLQSCILLEPDVRIRAALLSKLIDLAGHLKALQNFSGVCQVMYAVNSSPVARLADTCALVSPADRAREQELTALVVPMSNFRNLRALLRTALPPVVPPLFLAGKDIYSLEEATETRTADGKLNWNKLQKIARLSIDATQAGKHPYPMHASLEPETLKVFARFLMNPSPVEPPDRLTRLSILCQPVLHK